jgi:dihydroxyacetone kinase DhaKLM complex PTS-EIIA-like component DhaM
MAQGKVAIVAAGGAADGSLGTSMEKVLEALQKVDGPDGTLILLDLGSAVMTAEMAIEVFMPEASGQIIISSAPLVEGAVIAAVEASIGNSLAEVMEAAESAHTLPKVRSKQKS